MGSVFRAHDTRDGSLVALKLLHPERAAQKKAIEQFRNEVEALKGISHPAVVKLIDYGESGGFYYLVMEFVEGQTLRTVLLSNANSVLAATLRSEVAEDLAAQLFSALAAIHRAGLVHADIKPENLMIASNGRLRIVDFGLSVTNASLSLPETVSVMAWAGTISYSAPELIRGSSPTPRSDIFSAGCVLFEILTGKQLFGGKTAWAVAESILGERISFNAVDSKWRPILSKCLNRNASRRFADGGAVERALTPKIHKRRSRVLWAAVLAVGLIASLVTARLFRWQKASDPRVVTYDLSNDWRSDRNPNGAWTYAQGETPLPFQPRLGITGCFGGEQGVTGGYAMGTEFGGDCVPAFIKASGNGNRYSFRVGDILIHSQDPGNGAHEGQATLIWTAPTTGGIVYDGEIWFAQVGVERGDDFTFYLGSKVLRRGSVSDYQNLGRGHRDNSVQFSDTVSQKVYKGEQLRLVIVRSAGNDNGSAAGVQLRITETALAH